MQSATPEWVLEYLEIVLQHNELPKFVSARITYAKAPQDLRKTPETLYTYYVGALYEKHQKGDVENLDQKVFEAFAEMLPQRLWFFHTLKMYKQLLLCEEAGTATFRLPRQPLFALIRKNLLENAPFYAWHPQPKADHGPILPSLLSDLEEIHRITGEWIIPEDRLQALKKA